MNFEFLYDLLIEKDIEDMQPIAQPVQKLIKMFHAYDLDKILSTFLNSSNKINKTTKCFFIATSYLYKYDLKSFKKILDSIKIDKTIFSVLKIEGMILKKKLHELSEFSNINNEITKEIRILVSENSDLRIQSLAKTLEGDSMCLAYKFDLAINQYKEALEIDGKNIRAQIGLAKAHYYLEDYDNSEKILNNIKTKTINSSALKYKGKILKKRGRASKAIKVFKNILKNDPNYIDIYYDLFEIYSTKDNKKPGEILKKIEKFFPYYLLTNVFLFHKAIFLYNTGSFDQSINILRTLLSKRYKKIQTIFLLGKVLSIKASKTKQENTQLLEEGTNYQTQAINMVEEELKLLDKSKSYNKKVVEKFNKLFYQYYRSLAISYGFMGKYEEAIKILLDLYIVNNKDFSLIKNIAITYSQFHKYKKAKKYFEKIIKLKEKNEIDISSKAESTILREYGYCLIKLRELPKAEKTIIKAQELNSDDFKINLALAEAQLNLKKFGPAKQNVKIYLQKDKWQTYIDVAKGLLDQIELCETSDTLPSDLIKAKLNIISKLNKEKLTSEYMKKIEDRFLSKLKRSKTITKSSNKLVILRRWNSYSPILKEFNSRGGGYFFCYKGEGIVIDPGFNFVENFFEYGLSLQDIDKIVISHAHNDHMSDLESIFTLIFEYNKTRKPLKDKHSVELFINVGCYKKIINYINLRNKDIVNNVVVLNKDMKYKITDNITLHTHAAKHDEIISDSYALSFVFKLGTKKALGFTNDTGFSTDLLKFFNKFSLSIFILHLGTIKDFEFNSLETYSKHLGLNGIINMITNSKSEINIISEFGEEFRKKRIKFANFLAEEFNKIVLAADTRLTIDINKLEILESVADYDSNGKLKECKYLPPEEISTTEHDFNLYYHHKDLIAPDSLIIDQKKGIK